MDEREKISEFLKERGPSVPNTISKCIARDSIFTSAFLSEMKDAGKVKISALKIGGSPLYFLPGQENQLQDFSGNLGEKDKKAYELLKEKRVLKDSDLVPVFRLALRTIKDFASPLNVTFNEKKELFWKWYLLSNEDAEQILKNIFKNQKKNMIAEDTIIEQKTVVEKANEKKAETRTELKDVPKRQEKIDERVEKKLKLEFYDQVKDYLKENKILIIEESIIKKKFEIDFIVDVPSPVGNLRYYCKAKSKKKISEGDLSSAFVIGQSKRLPVLYISSGNLVKKAAEMLEREFKGMKVNTL